MWEKENKVRQYILPIGYTVVMTLCVPLHMMLLECALLEVRYLPFSPGTRPLTRQR